MTERSPREHIALGIITLSLLVGGAWILVVPRMENLRDRRAELVQLQEALNALSLGPSGQSEAVDQAIFQLQERAEAIGERSQLAANAEQLYEQVAENARRFGLTVAHISPGEAVDDREGILTRNLRISCSGSFQALDQFMQSLDQIEAYHRVLEVEMLPFGLEVDGKLTSTIGIAVYQFELNEALRSPISPEAAENRVASEEVGP